jgi:hypothetical protein
MFLIFLNLQLKTVLTNQKIVLTNQKTTHVNRRSVMIGSSVCGSILINRYRLDQLVDKSINQLV